MRLKPVDYQEKMREYMIRSCLTENTTDNRCDSNLNPGKNDIKTFN